MSVKRVVETKQISHEEWLDCRRKYITGSDAAAIAGMNPFATLWSVYADKHGLRPEKEDTEAMRLGRDLEQYVANRFTEESGMKTRRVNAILTNTNYPFAAANVDRVIVKTDAGLECKTTSAFNTKRFRDHEFPSQYYCQCVHYMAVTGKSRWYLAVLVLGVGFHIYRLTRLPDDPVEGWVEDSVYIPQEEINALMEAEEAFYRDHVLTDTPPDTDGDAKSTKIINDYMGSTPNDTIQLYCNEALQSYMDLSADIKVLEEQKERIKQDIILEMGGAAKGTCGKWEISNVKVVSNRFDTKAFKRDYAHMDLSKYNKPSDSVRFSIKEAK